MGLFDFFKKKTNSDIKTAHIMASQENGTDISPDELYRGNLLKIVCTVKAEEEPK